MGGMDFAFFYDFSIGFWNCGDIVCFSFYYINIKSKTAMFCRGTLTSQTAMLYRGTFTVTSQTAMFYRGTFTVTIEKDRDLLQCEIG
jgi:hypothetical protein